MTAKSTEALASFMKKQINEKVAKKSLIEQSIFTAQDDKDGEDGDKEKDKDIENLSEEEEKEKKELEDAKLASRLKVAQMDQTDMLKKLIIQNAVKFALVICVMAALAYAIIEVGPALFSSLNGAVLNALISTH